MAGALDAFNTNRRSSYDDTQGMFDQITQRKAGGMLAGGDYTGAAGALYGGGLLSQGSQVQAMGQQQQDRATKISNEETAERLKFLSHSAEVLLSIPEDQRAQAFQASVAPALQAMGAKPEVIAQAGAQLDNTSLQTFGAQTKKALLEIVKGDDGTIYSVDRTTGKPTEIVKGTSKPDWREVTGPDGSTTFIDLNKAGGAQGAPPSATPAPAAVAAAPQTDALFSSLIQQESGGRPGVLGPQTQYGRAEGMTQMLPATAKDMADKLGVPWRPDLMRGKTPEAAAYQTQLGKAYFEEGLQKYDGDPAKALMYYHGGPNERLWGPKTRAYAQQVLERAGGGGTNTLRGGSGADTVPPGSIRGSAPKRPSPPSGYRWEGDALEPIKGGPADPNNRLSKAPTEATSKAAAFTYRTLRANDRLNALADQGIFKPATVTSQLIKETQQGLRIVARTDEDRKFMQAAKEWLAPILRKDTGAAVTDAELATYMDIYIPRFEDDQATMQQKAEARQDAMIALAGEAGPTYAQRYGGKRNFVSKYPAANKKAAGNASSGTVYDIYGRPIR